jgi:hypothetical protein
MKAFLEFFLLGGCFAHEALKVPGLREIQR